MRQRTPPPASSRRRRPRPTPKTSAALAAASPAARPPSSCPRTPPEPQRPPLSRRRPRRSRSSPAAAGSAGGAPTSGPRRQSRPLNPLRVQSRRVDGRKPLHRRALASRLAPAPRRPRHRRAPPRTGWPPVAAPPPRRLRRARLRLRGRWRGAAPAARSRAPALRTAASRPEASSRALRSQPGADGHNRVHEKKVFSCSTARRAGEQTTNAKGAGWDALVTQSFGGFTGGAHLPSRPPQGRRVPEEGVLPLEPLR